MRPALRLAPFKRNTGSASDRPCLQVFVCPFGNKVANALPAPKVAGSAPRCALPGLIKPDALVPAREAAEDSKLPFGLEFGVGAAHSLHPASILQLQKRLLKRCQKSSKRGSTDHDEHKRQNNRGNARKRSDPPPRAPPPLRLMAWARSCGHRGWSHACLHLHLLCRAGLPAQG
jgi:hypothetical protein